MLDKYVVPKLRPPLHGLARNLYRRGLRADALTVVGFCIGLLTVPLLASGQFLIALIALLLNRLADGLDGELARLEKSTDAGAFLDISLDFIFYALFPLGFALHDPSGNALAAAILITSFVGTGASFLAFATQAEKQGAVSPNFSYKGLFYLDGLAEGTETIVIFVLMCLFPGYFVYFAYAFAAVCVLTSANRIFFGYQTLKNNG